MSALSTILAKAGEVAKAIAAAVLPLVTVALANGSFDWRAILTAALTAIAVYLIPNYVPKVVAQVLGSVDQPNAPPAPAVVVATPKAVIAPVDSQSAAEAKGVIG